MPSTTDPRNVPEIREAIALFEKWEAGITDPAAAGRFAEAIQLLDEYRESEPDSPHKAFVQNLKVSNARREDFNAFVSVWGKENAEALEQVSSKRSE
jgi:hypothetical protein